jgi:hypothetical protein
MIGLKGWLLSLTWNDVNLGVHAEEEISTYFS